MTDGPPLSPSPIDAATTPEAPADLDTIKTAVAPGEPPIYASTALKAGSPPPHSIALDRPTNVRYTVLAWTCSLSMLTYIDRVCISRVRGDMQDSLGLTETDFGWIFGAFGLAYAAFEVPSGWLGDRFGPRIVLTRIVLWWSLFTALTGLVWQFSYPIGFGLVLNSFVVLLIVRFLFGMGEAGAYPNSARALRNWFPYSRRGMAQGLLWSCGRLGGAMATTVVVVFAMPFGWRGAFIAFGVLGALWALIFAYFFRNTPSDHPGVNEAERAYIQEKGDEHAKLPISWGSMLRSRTIWCLSGMYLCSNAGWCFFITWDKKYYESVLGLESTGLMIAESSPLFFGAIACLAGGFITDWQVRILGRRWGRTLQGFISYGLGACFFVLALVTPRDQPALSVAFLCAASFCKDFAMAVSWSTCIDIGHRYSGTVAGFMNGLGNLGTFFGPLIVAHLAKQGDWSLALVFSAIMFSIASVCWLFINPRKVIVYAKADHANLKAQGVFG